jgi:hypothetical protein
MKKAIFIIHFFLLFTLIAQSQAITPQDKVALEIPLKETYATAGISTYIKEHFSSDSERIRAIFVWVSNNINYDVEKLLTKKQERTPVSDVLKGRKAVCQGYADLFVALCNECNIKAALVGGYTKLMNGFIADLSHAWVAASINNKWYLFDPTWAAGSVNDKYFRKSFSTRYYKLTPEEMIKDHMPFDPMYQFLDYPIAYDDFNGIGVAKNKSKTLFNYADTISRYNSLDTLSQFIGMARRINNNGEKNQRVLEVLQVLNKNMQSGSSKIGFDEAVKEFNKATALFNKYIDFKNARFSLIKNDKEIQQLIDEIFGHVKTVYSILENVTVDNQQNRQAVQSLNSAVTRFYYKVDEENNFQKNYFKKNRSMR